MLPNVLEFPISYYGVLRAGGVVVPMNVLLKRREIAFYLEDSGAKLLLAWHGFGEEARDGAAEDAGAELIEVEPRSFAELLGRARAGPRAGRHRGGGHRGDPLHLRHHRQAEGRRADPLQPPPQRRDRLRRRPARSKRGDVVLGALPLFHSFGQTVSMNASLRVGATLTLLPKFDPGEALEIMQRDRVTHFYGVPTMYGALLHHPGREQLRHLRAADLHHRRRLDAGRGAARLRGGLRLRTARGLRPLGDLAGRQQQPPRPAAQAGLDRHAAARGRDEGRRRERRGGRRRARSARS